MAGHWTETSEVINSSSDQDYDSGDKKTWQAGTGEEWERVGVLLCELRINLDHNRGDCGKINQDCVV